MTSADYSAPSTLVPVEIDQRPPAQMTNLSATASASSGIQPPRRQVSNISLPKKKSGLVGACSNLVNSIVGAGIIGIPFALKEGGLVAGIILLILVSYFTDKTLRMLVELASFSPRLKDYGVLTFEDLLSVRPRITKDDGVF
jgi:solute carrier family 38 (sodium-coupled neutral amino acid transporter), member 11